MSKRGREERERGREESKREREREGGKRVREREREGGKRERERERGRRREFACMKYFLILTELLIFFLRPFYPKQNS